MLHITDIQTNIKFPGSICLSGLSPHIFISGPNASGKTSLINAVELALTGEVRDIGGRDKAKAGTILQGLMHPNENSLFAVVKLSNGQTASWVMERGKRPVHQPLPGNVHFLLPEIMGMLKGSKAVVARFFIKHFGKEATIPEIDYGVFGDYLQEKLPPHLKLLAIEESARKSASAHTAEARALKTALGKIGVTSDKGAEHAHKASILSAIIKLLRFQVDNNLDQCGVCASPLDPHTASARGLRAKAQLDRFGGDPSSAKVGVLQEALVAAKHQAEVAKAISDLCMETMYQVVEAMAPAISLAISAHLPSDMNNCVGIEVKKSSILVGLYHPDEEFTRPHISGAELVTLCTAVGGAVSQRLPVGDLAVLTTPDRGLDLDYLRRLLSMMKQIPAVTIIQSPFQPRGRPSVNWTRIVLEDDGSLTVHGENTEGYSATA